MKISVQYGPTDDVPDPGRIAYEAEIRGFHGIYFPEHTHMPVGGGDIPYSGNEERVLRYRRLHSPLVAMAWAASTTKTIKLGACVALPAQHDPIILAKTLTGLDAMSGGRIQYGFGFGWQEPEMEAHGVDPKRKRATTREKMLAVKSLWTEDEAAFDGEIYKLKPTWMWPKPPAGRIPLLLGAAGTDQVFDHIIEYCEGWMPPLRGDPKDFVAKLDYLRKRCADAGRDPKTLQIDVLSVERVPGSVEALSEAGVDSGIVHLPFGGLDVLLPALDDYAARYL